MEEQGAQRLAANSVLFIWSLFSFLLMLNGLDQKGLDWISMRLHFQIESIFDWIDADKGFAKFVISYQY